MFQSRFKKSFVVSGSLALGLVFALWSFNVLSALFGGPQAQFKHAVAVMGVLLLIKWVVNWSGGSHEWRSRPHQCLPGYGGGAHDQ